VSAPTDSAPVVAEPSPVSTARNLAAQRVIPLRHPGRWIVSILALVVIAQLAHGFATNPFYDWQRFSYWFFRPVILQGLLKTLEITAYAAVLSLLLGILLALARLSSVPLLRAFSWTYVWIFRSVPLMVVLIFVYNFSALYTDLGIGIPFGPIFASFGVNDLLPVTVMAVIGLSLNESAFAAEVVRSGILSVDQGQHEAASALGIPKGRQFRRIVLPQALRTIVPSYVNLLIGLIKGTSLIYYVSVLDLFGQVQSMGSTYPTDIIPLLLVASVWYLILTSIVSVVQYYVERHYSKGALRTLPPTPLQRLRAGVKNLTGLLPGRAAA
jgi:polar amino acid transport system permease protein